MLRGLTVHMVWMKTLETGPRDAAPAVGPAPSSMAARVSKRQETLLGHEPEPAPDQDPAKTRPRPDQDPTPALELEAKPPVEIETIPEPEAALTSSERILAAKRTIRCSQLAVTLLVMLSTAVGTLLPNYLIGAAYGSIDSGEGVDRGLALNLACRLALFGATVVFMQMENFAYAMRGTDSHGWYCHLDDVRLCFSMQNTIRGV